jgi:hypothetical protein
LPKNIYTVINTHLSPAVVYLHNPFTRGQQHWLHNRLKTATYSSPTKTIVPQRFGNSLFCCFLCNFNNRASLASAENRKTNCNTRLQRKALENIVDEHNNCSWTIWKLGGKKTSLNYTENITKQPAILAFKDENIFHKNREISILTMKKKQQS